MLALTRRSLIATAVTFGPALSMPCSTAAFPAPIAASPAMPSRTSQFQQGDLVRLRSGGPLMTVADTRGAQVYCFWTDANNQPNDATFPVQVLQKF
jgi:uncharacterized protein YodC (DUF2158 family)